MIRLGPDVVEWVTTKLGVDRNAYGAKAVGMGIMDREGVMRAGVVYGPFNGFNVHAHIASDGSRRWVNRAVLTDMFAVPFLGLGARRITATTDATNQAAVDFLEDLGFSLMGRLPESSNSGGDMLIYQIGRKECRWIS